MNQKRIFTLLLIYLALQPGICRAVSIVHTSQNDFSSGTFCGWGMDVTSNGGGDVRLALASAELIPGFSTTTAMPSNMRNHAAAVWNARIYVSGGVTSGGVLVYSAPVNPDGSLGSWVSEPSLPAGRTLHAMAAWNKRVYVTGGFSGTPQASVYSAPINSDGTLGSWVTESNSLPSGRYRHAMVSWNGRLYVAGGDNTSIVKQSTVWSAPLNADGSVGSWRTETSMPDVNAYHSMQVFNSRLYVTGGLEASDAVRNVVWSAPINSDGTVGNWITESNSLPAGRYDHDMSVANGRLVIAGGFNFVGSSAVFSAPINSDGTVGNWITEAIPIPEPRYQHTMSFWNGRIYIVGGLSLNQDRVYVAPLNALGRATTEDTQANALPGGRREHRMVAWNGRLYVAGGIDNFGNLTSSVFSAPINTDGTVGAWTTESNSLPYAPAGHAMVVWNGRLYVSGGRNQFSCSGAVIYTNVYSAAINANGSVGPWTTEANTLPSGRTGHGMVAMNGRLYVVAGANPCTAQSTVYSAPINSDGSVGNWVTEANGLPDTLQFLAATAWNGRIYTSGGVNSGGNRVGSVYSAPINANGSVGTWTAETGMPGGRSAHTMVAWNSKLFVAGGESGGGINSPVSYQPFVAAINPNGSVGSWGTESISLFGARNYPASTIWNGKIYITGGHWSPGITQAYVQATRYQYYSTTGTYTSPLIDLGEERNLDSISWTQSASPVNSTTTVLIATSTAGGANLNALALISNGVAFNTITRYIQYRIGMTPGGNPQTNTPTGYDTPVIGDVTIVHNPDIVNPARSPVLNPVTVSSVSITSVTITYLDRSVGETHFKVSTGSVTGPANDAYIFISTPGSVGVTDVSTLTALIPNTTYFIRVRGFNAPENVLGVFSNEVSTTTFAADPVLNSPEWLVSDVYITSITARWQANGNPFPQTRYRVEFATSSSFVGTVTSNDTFALSLSSSNVQPNGPIAFRVQAINHTGLKTNFAVSITTLTLAGGPALNSPNFASSDIHVTSTTARWNPNGNPTGTLYRIELANNPSFSGAITSSDTYDLSFTTMGLLPNTTIAFRVAAFNNGGILSPFTTSVATSTLVLPPVLNAPNWDPSDITAFNATARWSTNGNPFPQTIFTVQFATSGDFTSPGIILTEQKTTLFDISPEISTNTPGNWPVAFRVQAENHQGIKTAFATAVATVTFARPPVLNAQHFTDSDVGITSVTARWNANGNAPGTKYRVQFFKNPNFTGTPTTQETFGFSASSAGLLPNTTVTFRVQASNNNGLDSAFASANATGTRVAAPGLAGTQVNISSISVTLSPNGYPAGCVVTITTGAGGSEFEASNSSFSFLQDGGDIVLALSGLAANTVYTVKARASNFNNVHSSATVALTTSTLAGPPSIVGFSVYTTSAAVRLGANGNPDGTQVVISTGTDGHFGVTLSSSGSLSGGEATLAITGLSTNTFYGLQAASINPGGSVNRVPVTASTWTLAVQPAVQSYTVHSTSITAVLELNSNPPQTVLVISSGDFETSSSSSGAAVTLSLPGLTPNTTYTLRARSENSTGSASEDVPVASTRTQAAVPGDTVFTQVQLSSITIQWDSNGNPLLPPTSYQVEVSKSEDFSESGSSVTFALQYATAALVSNTSYFFRIRAFNRDGVPSEFNTVRSAFTGAKPLIVSGFSVYTTSVSATLLRNGNAPGSLVKLSTGTNSDFSVALSSYGAIPGDAVTLTVFNLSTNTAYSFQAGVEGGGVTVKTDVTGSTVTLSVPPRITGLAATHNSVTVTLDPETNPQGTVLEASTNSFATVLAGPGFSFSSLAPNSPYTVMARSVNQNGSPSGSVSVSTFTRSATPADIRNAQATLTSLEFAWDANGNPPGTQYSAELYLGQQAELARSDTVQAAGVTFSGLSIGTLYTVYLRALNQDGSPGDVVSLSTRTRNTTPPDPKVSVTTGSYVMTWNFQPDGQGYRVRDMSSKLLAELPAGATTFSESGLFENQKIGRQVEYFNQFITTPIFTLTFYTAITPPRSSAEAMSVIDKGSTWLKIRVTPPPNPQEGKTAVRLRLVPVGKGIPGSASYRATGLYAVGTAQTILADFSYPDWEKTVTGLVPGTQYAIEVSYVNADGSESPAGSVALDVFVGFNVGEEGIKIEKSTFFVSQGIDFIVSSNQSGNGDIKIYGVEQNLVRSIPFTYGPGITSVRWDGKDGGGEPVFTDVYWVVIETIQFGKQTLNVAAIR